MTCTSVFIVLCLAIQVYCTSAKVPEDLRAIEVFLILLLINPLDPTTAVAGLSVQSWNGRQRPHTGPTIQRNPGE